MNDRTKQLAEQADLYARSDNSSMLFENWKKQYTERLTELIVRECADKIEHDYKYERGEDTKWITAFAIASDLKAHFGVQ